MLGLIKKDLLMIRNNLKVLVVFLIVFIFMAFQGFSDISFILVFMSIMIFMSTFSYDEYNKFNAFVISFPDGRKNTVRAKYIASLLLILGSFLLTIISLILIGFIKNNIDWDYLISVSLGSLFACVVIQSLLFPFIFKYGMEKARIGFFVGTFGISCIITVLAKMKIFKLSSSVLLFLESYWPYILLILAISLLGVSYFISSKIYAKKEF